MVQSWEGGMQSFCVGEKIFAFFKKDRKIEIKVK